MCWIAFIFKAAPILKRKLAGVEAMVGNHEEASTGCDKALQLSRTLSVTGNVATTFAILRQEQKALALADEIQRTHPNDTIAINVTVPVIKRRRGVAPRKSG